MAFLDEAEKEIRNMGLGKEEEDSLLAEVKEINEFEDSLEETE